MNRLKRILNSPALPWAIGLLVYALAAGYTVLLATSIHAPCTTSFEGGCGYGKTLGGIISCLSAILAAAAGAGLLGLARSLQAGPSRTRAVKFTLTLLAVPASYLLYCLYWVAAIAAVLLR